MVQHAAYDAGGPPNIWFLKKTNARIEFFKKNQDQGPWVAVDPHENTQQNLLSTCIENDGLGVCDKFWWCHSTSACVFWMIKVLPFTSIFFIL